MSESVSMLLYPVRYHCMEKKAGIYKSAPFCSHVDGCLYVLLICTVSCCDEKWEETRGPKGKKTLRVQCPRENNFLSNLFAAHLVNFTIFVLISLTSLELGQSLKDSWFHHLICIFLRKSNGNSSKLKFDLKIKRSSPVKPHWGEVEVLLVEMNL